MSERNRPIDETDPLQPVITSEPGEGSKGMLNANSEEIPEEIQNVLSEYGLNKKQFRCILKEVASNVASTNSTNSGYIDSWQNHFPSINYIALHYGPGTYILDFVFRVTEVDEETGKYKSPTKHHTANIDISSKYQEMYDEFQFEQRLKRRKRRTEKLAEEEAEARLHNIENRNEGEKIDPVEAGKRYVDNLVEAGAKLGLMNRQPQSNAVMEGIMNNLPALLTTFVTIQQSARAQQDKFMQLMISQMQNSQTQMIELMKVGNGQGQGNQMMKEMMEMIMGGLEIKEALTGTKETITDKVMKMIEGVAPMMLTMMSMPKHQRVQQVPYQVAQQIAQNNPDIQAVKKDPSLLVEMVNRLDAHYGWQQTNGILEVVGAQRPEECSDVDNPMRNPDIGESEPENTAETENIAETGSVDDTTGETAIE